jgi:hypothetical protein
VKKLNGVEMVLSLEGSAWITKGKMVCPICKSFIAYENQFFSGETFTPGYWDKVIFQVSGDEYVYFSAEHKKCKKIWELAPV